MSNPSAAFIEAEGTALRTALNGLGTVFVEVPTNQNPPYALHGQHEIDDLSDGCGEVYSIVSTVQWWAKMVGATKGSLTARQMGAVIVATLKALTVPGYEVVLAEMEMPERYSTDPDQSTHGLTAFRFELTAQDV